MHSDIFKQSALPDGCHGSYRPTLQKQVNHRVVTLVADKLKRQCMVIGGSLLVLKAGRYKTWTLNSGLDYGLDFGMDLVF